MRETAPSGKERISNVRTGTEVGYAKKTWSNEQIVCDSFQNHLDAETRVFIKELSRRYLADPERALNKRASEDPKFKEDLSHMRYCLYLFAMRGADLAPERRAKEFVLLARYAKLYDIALAPACTVDAFATKEEPKLPEVTYSVRDMHARTERVFKGLTGDAVRAAFPDKERFQLVEAHISDTGSGYLPHKTALYLPSKDEPWDRGVWGEGSKVNTANTLDDPNAFVVNESVTKTADGTLKHWRRRMYSDGAKSHAEVMQRGFDETLTNGKTGSATIYRFAVTEKAGVRTAFDPRITPLSSIVGAYDKKFVYPTFSLQSDIVPPGVSLEPGTQQYLQGLRVGTGNEGFLFSYDFTQKEGLLSGRDRKHIDFKNARKLVETLWKETLDPHLICELAARVFAEGGDTTAPEYIALMEKLNWPQRWARGLPEVLGLSKTKRNILAPSWHFLDDAQRAGSHIVNIAPIIKDARLRYLVATLRSLRPEYDIVHISELEQPAHKTEEQPWNEQELAILATAKQAQRLESELIAPFVHAFSFRVPEPIKLARSSWVKMPQIQLQPSEYGKIELFLTLPENTELLPADLKPEDLVPRLLMARLVSYSMSKENNPRFTVESGYLWLKFAQDAAQSFLDEASRPSDILTLDHHIGKRVSALIDEQGARSFSPQKMQETSLEYLQTRQRSNAADITPTELFDIAAHDVRSAAAGSMRAETAARVLSDGVTCSFFVPTYDDLGVLTTTPQSIQVNDLPLEGTWNGKDVRKLPDGRLVIPLATPVHSVLRHEYRNDFGKLSLEQQIVLGDDILSVEGAHVYSIFSAQGVFLSSQSYPRLDRGCIIARNLSDLDGWEFLPSNADRSQNESPVREEIMASPITLEYINELWQDPRRIFQDITQNHADASPLPPEERFLVVRDGAETWVSAADLGQAEILGYEMSDAGPGYLPNGIQNMGHSEKRNPMLTGKNGEGLKLAAASALKAGFTLQYASIALGSTSPVSWTADAMARPFVDETEGTSRTVTQLCFAIQTGAPEDLVGAGARTRVRIPSGADAATMSRWRQWAQIVDPRNTNDFGEHGIGRYVLGKEQQGAYVTVGPVTAFFDRPGHIYENGNFIRNEAQDSRAMLLGWNFPNITDTRERDRYDPLILRSYVRHFFENTDDVRAIDALLKNIFRKEADYGGQMLQAMTQSELSPEFALKPSIASALSLPLFRKRAAELFPGKVLFCEDAFREMNESARGNANHIPLSNRMIVSSEAYEVLSHIFPNMQEYAEHVKTLRVTVPETDLSLIRDTVATRANDAATRLERMREDPSTQAAYRVLLGQAGVREQTLYDRLHGIEPRRIAGTAGDVFVGPDDSTWDGVATLGTGSIGINARLLYPFQWGRLSSTIDHEIGHQMTGASDYTSEFIATLALLALSKAPPRQDEPGWRL